MAEPRENIGFLEARTAVLNEVSVLEPVEVPLGEACGLVLAEDLVARVDSPSVSASLKDGFAVVSSDVARAAPENAIRLKIVGRLGAGGRWKGELGSGETVKIMTGAPLPRGATAVLPSELALEGEDSVECMGTAEPGRNVLPRGSDVRRGDTVLRVHDRLSPGRLGLAAAAGLSTVRVFPRPRVGIVATGDEIVLPGAPLRNGQLYASNLVTLDAWLDRFDMESSSCVVPDREEELRTHILSLVSRNDALLISGGLWKSERDLTVRVLNRLGWRLLFRGVRMGPGKGAAFGTLEGVPVFCLPGGPPSNEIAFLQIALPGLLAMCARFPVPFVRKQARLEASVRGDGAWTQFIYARLLKEGGEWRVSPLRLGSRLASQAFAQALITLPEGEEMFPSGAPVAVEVLDMDVLREEGNSAVGPGHDRSPETR